MSTFLAVDFGAGSGRVMAGVVRDGQLELDELHRFPNRQVRIGRHLYWDFPSLFQEMKEGLRRAAEKYGDVESIGIDTWGVDFGLVDAAGNLMGNPICYRDGFTEGMPDEVFRHMDLAAHYAEVDIQVMPINTMFQLYALDKENSAWLREARHLLFMPDLFAYFLTGVPGYEYSIASTSELLDARKRVWNKPLVEALGLPARLFEDRLFMPGEVRGTLLPAVAEEVGLPATVKVVAVGSHDTANAIHAVPFQDGKETTSAFLSSGTWSLLGIVQDEPILSEKARLAGFTNEGGVGGKVGGGQGTALGAHDGEDRQDHREGAAAQTGQVLDGGHLGCAIHGIPPMRPPIPAGATRHSCPHDTTFRPGAQLTFFL